MAFSSIESMIEKAAGMPLWEAVLADDMAERGCTREDSIGRMAQLWQTMLEADGEYDPAQRSISGLVGGDGGRMAAAAASGESVCGSFMGMVMARALKMGECNACMKRIVAAPTAGSCGVLPAVLISCKEQFGLSDDDIVQALFVAAGSGQVIAQRAFISGAEGGCQAEIGSASAMAAAAVVTLRGGTPEQAAHAVAMALKNLLGLVCDPVAGLVEVPCVKRNVIGAVNALTSADMALAGIRSAIPPDEVIDAMRSVGERMHLSLKETAEGGLAATPTARLIAAEVMGG